MRKILPYIIICCFCVVFTIILFVSLNNKTVQKFFVYEKNYNVVYDEDNKKFNVDVYVNDKKCYLVDKTQVKKCAIIDKENSSIINISLETITDSNNEIDYDGEKYYQYLFTFNINFNTEEEIKWYFEQAILQINYNGNLEYDILIGQFSFVKVKNNSEDVIISYIKPIITEIETNSYLSGLILGLRKSENCNNVKINYIEIMNTNMHPGELIDIVKERPLDNTFEDIFGYNFINTNIGDGNINYNINDDDIIYIKIPIYYERLYLTTSFPLKINYSYNNKELDYYLYDYTFYNPTNEVISKQNIHFYNLYD